MYISVDIDIDDILYSLSSSEQKRLLIELLEEMDAKHIQEAVDKLKNQNKKLIAVGLTNESTFIEHDFNNCLTKLSANYISLKKEDQDIIEEIAKKY